MAKQFVTFAARDAEENFLPQVWVRVYDSTGSLIVDALFLTYSTINSPIVVTLPAGEYSAHVLADGHVFPYPYEFEVVEGMGETENEFGVITFDAESVSAPISSGLPFMVYGVLPTVAPSQTGSLLGYGITVKGETGALTVYDSKIAFLRVDTVSNQAPQLAPAETVYAALDRNGRFEALLRPNSLYRISAPGVRGSPFIQTGAAGEKDDLYDLIAASVSSSPYDLVTP